MSVIALILFIAALPAARALRSRIAPAWIFAGIVLLSELLIFNFDSAVSLFYKDAQYTVSPSRESITANDEFIISSASDFIEFNISDGEAKNVFFECDSPLTTVNIFASDEGNSIRYYTGKRSVSSFERQSRFIKLNLTGKADSIRLYFPDADSDNVITVSDARLNAVRPVFFSLLRAVLLFIILFFIYYVFIDRRIWSDLCSASRAQRRRTVAIAAATGIVFLIIASLNPAFVSPNWTHHRQYDMLADSLLSGRLDIDYAGADVLSELENPYDTAARKEAFSAAHQAEPWDVSFFNGKFYVYFGVLPAVLFYMPFRLISSASFPNFMGVVLFSWLLIAAVFLLIKKIIDIYCKKIPYLLYIFLCEAVLFSGGTVYLLKRPDFYSIPVMGGVAFVMMGLYFWISAAEKPVLSMSKLCIGSVFMALVSMLRPNLLFFSGAAFVIFWKSVLKDRELIALNSRVSKEKNTALKNTIAFCAPYAVAALIVMTYNYLRFGSPFDFGAAYNLTTSDMTRRAFSPDRWGLGVFEYLLRPPTMSAVFPYLKSSSIDTLYIGFTSREAMYGGLFMVSPLLWSYLAVGRAKRSPLFPPAVFMGVMSFVTVLLDIQAGGILPRYSGDFSAFFAVGAVLIVLALYDSAPEFFKNFAAFAFGAAMMYAFMLIFADGSSTLRTTNPELFTHVYCALNPFM